MAVCVGLGVGDGVGRWVGRGVGAGVGPVRGARGAVGVPGAGGAGVPSAIDGLGDTSAGLMDGDELALSIGLGCWLSGLGAAVVTAPIAP